MGEEAYIETSVPTYKTTRTHVLEACRFSVSLQREPRIIYAVSHMRLACVKALEWGLAVNHASDNDHFRFRSRLALIRFSAHLLWQQVYCTCVAIIKSFNSIFIITAPRGIATCVHSWGWRDLYTNVAAAWIPVSSRAIRRSQILKMRLLVPTCLHDRIQNLEYHEFY
jgi:hypothetical protein